MTDGKAVEAFSSDELQLALPLFAFVELGVFETVISEFREVFFGECQDFAKRCLGIKQMLRENGKTEQERDAADDEFEKFFRFPSRYEEPQKHLKFLKMCIQANTRVVTFAWIAALKAVASKHGALRWLRTDILDESMLPRSCPEADEAFEAMLKLNANGSVDVAGARLMLSQSRAHLPSGQIVPEAMVALMKHCDITVAR